MESEDGSYEEETKTLDVSSDGLSFLAGMSFEPEQLLRVTGELPSPVRDRHLRFMAIGRVIYCRPQEQKWAVGLLFDHPPEMQLPD